ncbi:MAG: glycoside hydrolase family 3 protein [Clostridia bacterium]|nr:glycoside hydrolase family 3 protein [Clostridia bacterium]
MADVKKLSGEEKLRLVMGENDWNNFDLDGKIYKFRVSDATCGLRMKADFDKSDEPTTPSTAYPSSQAIANSWDPKLAFDMGRAMANDCIEKGVDIVLGPGVNIKRLPVCGRNFEYYSEDPVLAGYIAKGYIEGLQSEHIGACVKHYCANNIEYARLFCSSEMDERTLREIYLRVFEIAMEAKPWTVMCSYNLLRGTLMSENGKMFDLLRDEFGFDGLVMSDWCAVRRSSRSINGGLDLEMPHHDGRAAEAREDYAAGLFDGKMLDRAAGRVVALAEKCGAESKKRKLTMTSEEREAFVVRAARESVVLLKNDGALPLKNETLLMTGAPERRFYEGGGSAFVTPTKPYLRLGAALRELGFDTSYREAVRDVVGGQACMNGSAVSCREELLQRDAAIIEVGDPDSVETECRDRQTIKLCKEEVSVIKYLRKTCPGKKIIVVVYAGSAIDMSDWIDDADAVVWAGYCGQGGNRAVAEILAGITNPSGRLSETFPLRLEDVRAMHSPVDPETVIYEEGLMVGYRYFETCSVPVLFPFGYGLSYSSFEYSNLSLSLGEDGLTAEFDIENTSDRDGSEVSQLYISFDCGEEGRPALELKGFAKTPVKAHGRARASIFADAKYLSYYSNKEKRRMPLDGFTVKIGRNCRDIVLTEEIKPTGPCC